MEWLRTMVVCTVVARRLAESVVPQLEGALRAYIASTPGSAERRAALEEILRLPAVLKGQLDQLMSLLESAEGEEQNARAAQRVRRLWRGL